MLIDNLMFYPDTEISALFGDSSVDKTNFINTYNSLSMGDQIAIDLKILNIEILKLPPATIQSVLDEVTTSLLDNVDDIELLAYINSLSDTDLNNFLTKINNILDSKSITNEDIMNYINAMDDNELFLFLVEFTNSSFNTSDSPNIPDIVKNYLSNATEEDTNTFIGEINSLLNNTISKIEQEEIAPQQKNNDEIIVKTLTHSLMNGEIIPFNSKRLDGLSLPEIKGIIADSMQKVKIKTSDKIDIFNANFVELPKDVFSIISVYAVSAVKGDHTILFDWEIVLENNIEVLRLDPNSATLIGKQIRIVYVPHKDGAFNTCNKLDAYAKLTGVQCIDSTKSNFVTPISFDYSKSNRVIKPISSNIQLKVVENNTDKISTTYVANAKIIRSYNKTKIDFNTIYKNPDTIVSKATYKANFLNFSYISKLSKAIKTVGNDINIPFEIAKLITNNGTRPIIIKKVNNIKFNVNNIYSVNTNKTNRIIKTQQIDDKTLPFDFSSMGANDYNRTNRVIKNTNPIDIPFNINYLLDYNLKTYPICIPKLNNVPFNINDFNVILYNNTKIIKTASSPNINFLNINADSSNIEALNNYNNISYNKTRLITTIQNDNIKNIVDFNTLTLTEINYDNHRIIKSYPDIKIDSTSIFEELFAVNYKEQTRLVKSIISNTISYDFGELTSHVENSNTRIVKTLASSRVTLPIDYFNSSRVYYATQGDGSKLEYLSQTGGTMIKTIDSSCDLGVILPSPGVNLNDLIAKSAGFILDKEIILRENQTLITNVKYTRNFIQVYLQGKLLSQLDYYAEDCNSIELYVPAHENDVLRVISFRTFEIANTYSKAEIDAMFIIASARTGFPILITEKEEVIENGTVTITIDNYNENMIYTMTSTDGILNRVYDKIYFTAPIIDADANSLPYIYSSIRVTAKSNDGFESLPAAVNIKVNNYNFNANSELIEIGDTILNKTDKLLFSEIKADPVTYPIANIPQNVNINANGNTEFVTLNVSNDTVMSPVYLNDKLWRTVKATSEHSPQEITMLNKYISTEGRYFQADRNVLILEIPEQFQYDILLSQKIDDFSNQRVVRISINDSDKVFRENNVVVLNIKSYNFNFDTVKVFKDNFRLYIDSEISQLLNPYKQLKVIGSTYDSNLTYNTNEIILDEASSKYLIDSSTSINSRNFYKNLTEFNVEDYKVIYNDVFEEKDFTEHSLYARWDFASCRNNEFIYMVGGKNKEGDILLNIQRYDIINNKFDIISNNMPFNLTDFEVVYRDNDIYLVGGIDVITGKLNKQILKFSLKDKIWYIIYANLPGFIEHKIVEYSKHIYIIGGIIYNVDRTEKYNTIIDYNILTNSFKFITYEQIDDFALTNHSTAIINDEIYVIGGVNKITGVYNDKFYKFSINGNSFVEYTDLVISGDNDIKSLTKKMQNVAVTHANNKLYFNGGTYFNNTTKVNENIFVFDTLSRKWSNLTEANNITLSATSGFRLPDNDLYIYDNTLITLFGLKMDGTVYENLSSLKLSSTNLKVKLNNFNLDNTLVNELLLNGIGVSIAGVEQKPTAMSYDKNINIIYSVYEIKELNFDMVAWAAKIIENGMSNINSSIDLYNVNLNLYEEA